jgi:hypothetical protein
VGEQNRSDASTKVASVAESTVEEVARRRARRAERRQKQRDANVDRAEKMHQARLADPLAVETATNDPLTGRIYIGCSGWYYWHWKGSFYPEEVDRRAQRAILFVADDHRGQDLDPTSGEKLRLYRQGLRVDHAYKAVPGNENSDRGLQLYLQPSWAADGMFSVSVAAQRALQS